MSCFGTDCDKDVQSVVTLDEPVPLIEYEMDQGEMKMIEITFGMALDGTEREERK